MSNKNESAKLSDQEKKIEELKKENLLLKREVATLKTEIQQSRAATRKLAKKRDNVQSMFLHQARRENTFSQTSKSAYFRHTLKNSSLTRTYSQILNSVRQLTFITTTIQVVLFALTILKSGVIFLISTSAFIISLPFITIISGIGTILTLLGSKKATAQNKPMLIDKNVCVFFPAKKSVIKEGTYFAGFVRSMAERPDTVCIIVTQGLFFSRGITKKNKYFFTSRIEEPNIILVRRHYYFKFKKSIIQQYSKNLTEIY